MRCPTLFVLLGATPAFAHQEMLAHAHPHGVEATMAIGFALAALAWLLWKAAR